MAKLHHSKPNSNELDSRYGSIDELTTSSETYPSEARERIIKLHSRLSAHKRSNLNFVSYCLSDEGQKVLMNKCNNYGNSHLHSISACGDRIVLRYFSESGKLLLYPSNRCNLHLLCPLCSIKRAAKRAAIVEDRYRIVMNIHPELYLHFIVMTVQNGPNLYERFEHLRSGVEKFRVHFRHAKSDGKKNAYAKSTFPGKLHSAAYSIELKRGENSKQWHPHVNFLALSEEKLTNTELSQYWHSITGDSWITYCENVPHIDKSGDRTVFVELFKYVTKFSAMENSDRLEVANLLKGRRLTGCIGGFYGIDTEPIDDDTELEVDSTEHLYYDYLLEYDYNTHHYVDVTAEFNAKHKACGHLQEQSDTNNVSV